MCGIVGILGQKSRSRPTSSTRCAGSSIAAMIRPASPPSRTATSSAAAPRASCATSKAASRSEPLQGHTGIGHTRWATHGASDRAQRASAHERPRSRSSTTASSRTSASSRRSSPPRATSSRPTPTPRRSSISSPTSCDRACRPIEAVKRALGRLQGAFALAIIFAGDDDLMIAARQGSPLAIGHGNGRDVPGLAMPSRSRRSPTPSPISTKATGRCCAAPASRSSTAAASASSARSSSRSPARCSSTRATIATSWRRRSTSSRRSSATRWPTTSTWRKRRVTLPDLGIDPATSAARHHVGLRHRLLRRPRRQVLDRALRAPAGRDRRGLRDALSRAAAVQGRAILVRLAVRRDRRHARRAALTPRPKAQRIAAVVNVRTSSIARESDIVLPTLAGPEIGVASTKAFTCQLSVLACMALGLGRARGTLSREEERKLVQALIEVPRHISTILRNEEQYEAIAHTLSKARDVLYLGRGTSYPLALEGALKLKEISYIHAEGYAAGELKHGPIALIDENVPVIVVAPARRPVRKDGIQHAGGRHPRRPDHPHLGCRRRRRSAARSPPTSPCRQRQSSPIRWFTPCRCNSSPTTRP